MILVTAKKGIRDRGSMYEVSRVKFMESPVKVKAFVCDATYVAAIACCVMSVSL